MLHETSNPAERRARNDENADQSPDKHVDAASGGCGCATDPDKAGGACASGVGGATASLLAKIEGEMRDFELAERRRLGIEAD